MIGFGSILNKEMARSVTYAAQSGRIYWLNTLITTLTISIPTIFIFAVGHVMLGKTPEEKAG